MARKWISDGGRRWRRRAIAMAASLLSFGTLLGISGAPANALAPGPVILYNFTTGKCADLPGYGTPKMNDPVTQYNCNFSAVGDNQAWDMVQVGNNGYRLYYFQTDKGGWCLDPPGYGADPAGTHLEVYPCAYGNPGGDNQEFYIKTVTYIGYNYTEIVNLKNSLCLDVSGWASDNSDLANNLPLTLYPCYDPSWDFGGYDDHMWELYNAN